MARNVRLVFFEPEIAFLLKGEGGAVHKDTTKRTFKVYRWARIYAPVRTGNLKAKIKYEVRTGSTGVRGFVISPVKYTMAVHEGSAPHVIRPKNKKALSWPGALHPVKVVHHPGTHSNPFLTKALARAVE